MTNRGYASMAAQTPVGALWGKACQALRRELGDDTFGSWLAQAAVREAPGGALVLVTPTGTARDWIRRNAWRRIGELWAQNDPEGRHLDLKSRTEFEAGAPIAQVIEIAAPVSSDVPAVAPVSSAPSRTAGLQERFTFDTFVPGPANEFAHAVARRVASWSDGHFNPVVFHGP
ncbi:MAG TPA: DnaA N-terminal domain-containing protein, partial [Caulobacteraceae bacterium]